MLCERSLRSPSPLQSAPLSRLSVAACHGSVMSPSCRIRATWDAKAGTRVEDVKRHKVLWSILDSHRSLLVADDGKHLVERYDGLNLLPTDFSDDLVLLTFCAKEKSFAM